ncbi:RNA polymerase subunit sigma-70 [Pedobacter sp. HMWF019]|uniref:sigma-70 family RNA polymerase sigma factor n=1 Tax=Pedobacter sp. HMWF019 TaxID=2056856 RepID=UPI000D38273A|nr:sigma-70 family RNA polymerase sigma factor [Pedobacter sp. HMWF019]PTS96011.1 RNA polymerase subunit sigma-70 [Pedobacter sp. HMWF019]
MAIEYSALSDAELTAFLKLNDHVAFSEIYQRYWKKLLLVSWNHCKDKAVTEDLLHEVFLNLWERRGEELDIHNLSAFLATSVKFSIFKYYQRQNRRVLLAKQNYYTPECTNDEELLDALFLKEYIDGIVETMPEKCRLVFIYSREKGMKNAQIAEELQISEKGVEANLTRALKIIRSNLKDSGVLILMAQHIYRDFF